MFNGSWKVFSTGLLELGIALLAVAVIGCKDASNKTAVNATLSRPHESMPLDGGEGAPESREAYDPIEENRFFETLAQPQSTFAIDVDTASYSNVRRLIRSGIKPPKGAIRLEELVNYFPYEYNEPKGESPFSVTTEIATCPWAVDHQLMRVAMRGRSIDLASRKPCNIVFLLDVSGSMQSNDKLPLVKSALKMLVGELNSDDRIAIVVYAGGSGLVLDSTPVDQSQKILAALDRLEAGGSTNGGAGIQLAYQVAQDHRIEGGVNRVILCTDGDFNVGVSSDSALVDLIVDSQLTIQAAIADFGSRSVVNLAMQTPPEIRLGGGHPCLRQLK